MHPAYHKKSKLLRSIILHATGASGQMKAEEPKSSRIWEAQQVWEPVVRRSLEEAKQRCATGSGALRHQTGRMEGERGVFGGALAVC